MKILRKVSIVFALLFCTELVLGFTGTMVMIGGIAIRHILFILAFVSLYVYFILYLWSNKIKIFSLKKEAYFGSYTWIDVMAVFFEVSMILSMTVIPWMKGTSLQYAHSEAFDSVAIFSLFFPVSFLIKKNEFKMDKLLDFLKYVFFVLALGHIFLYFAQDSNPEFIFGFFEEINHMLGGNSIAPSITLGHGGYTRVIFTTSVYLIVGVYIFLRNLEDNKWYDYIILISEILAVITTVTKSIWLGIGIGFAAFLVLGIFFNIRNGKKYILKLITVAIFAVLIIFVSDKYIFDNIVSIRMGNAFITTNTEEGKKTSFGEKRTYKDEKEKKMDDLDKEGAAQSNLIKLEQMEKLTEKWKKSPILGWGYGSYVEGYLRSKTSPFSYEMQFFALLMKIGILGLTIWALLFVIQLIWIMRYRGKACNKGSAWIFLTISVAVCVQTNPLLICFTGMSIVLLISLMSIQEIIDGKSEEVIENVR